MRLFSACLYCSLVNLCIMSNFAKAGICYEEWSNFGLYCYLSTSERVSASTWEFACNANGGHLASVHSSSEMAFITGIIPSGGNTLYYIGLWDRDGSLQYTDSTEYDYANWLSNPSQSGYDESGDCVAITSTGRWVYVDCSDNNGGVCKQDILCRSTFGKTKYYEHGSTISYYCRSGYYLDGHSTATCRNGEISPSEEELECRKICTRPITFDFKLKIRPLDLTFREGDTITYSCDDGYRLYGTQEANCTDTGFDPSEIPQCLENLKCHAGQKSVCEPSGSDCNANAPSNENVQQSVETCHDNAKLCFIYRYGVKGSSVSLNTTTAGCVTDESLDYSYGCYHDRSYLMSVDSSGAKKLSDVEERLGTRDSNVTVCFCDRDLCNESLETAARNAATTAYLKTKMILGSVMGCLSWWI